MQGSSGCQEVAQSGQICAVITAQGWGSVLISAEEINLSFQVSGQWQRRAGHFLGENSTRISAPRREGRNLHDSVYFTLCSWCSAELGQAAGTLKFPAGHREPGQHCWSSQMWDNLTAIEL